MKTDFYLRLSSASDMPTVFIAFYGGENLVLNTHDYAIDVLGTVYKPTGNLITDAEGNQYPETAPTDGWHVNLRLLNDNYRTVVESIDRLWGVNPNTPSRVWL